MASPKSERAVTVSTFRAMKAHGEKIAMLTCYDYSFARLLDAAGIDAILVGDSASNVMQGNANTLPITVEEMIYHTRCVVKGVTRPLVVIDMPFGSYQGGRQLAVASAVRMMKESGAGAVKLEGGSEQGESVKAIVEAGIPVMGHLGLTPQSIHQFGSYKVRATEDSEAERLLADAHALELAGVFSIVLEKVPARLAAQVAKECHVPIIGIGAGAGTDGQVLVLQDMLGMTQDFAPRFLRRYANLAEACQEAFKHYMDDVKSGDFPNSQERY